MSWLDQSAGGRILQWQRHFLTDVVRTRGCAHLLEEPSLRSPEEVGDRLLALRPVAGGLSLQVNGWAKLRVEPFPRPFAAAKEGRKGRDWRPAPARLLWSELPLGDAFDLTPFDGNDSPGVTTRVLRPADEPWWPFDFRYELAPLRDRIVFAPARRNQEVRFDRIVLEPLRLTGRERFEREGPGAGLEQGAGWWACPRNFKGVVAVVGLREGRRFLLDCRTVFNNGLAEPPRKVEEWKAIRKALGCEEQEARPWPVRSQDRLEEIGRAAADAGLPGGFAERYPRGVLRFLVLRECGLSLAVDEATVRDLDREPSLERILETRVPAAFSLLARTPDPASDPRSWLWILSHASLPDLGEIAKWAVSVDAETLTRATELFPFHKRIHDLVRKTRTECPLGQEMVQLAGEIDRALRSGERPAALDERIEALEKRLADEETGPPTPDQPAPSARQRFDEWQKVRARSQAWRRRVDRILTFCESGEWREIPLAGGGEIGLDSLARRAGHLALDFPLDEPDDPAASEQLRRLVAEVRANAGDEPASAARERILDHLARHVQPHPERWSALHAAMRRAGALAASWPQLAEAVGLSAAAAEDGEDRTARVALFLRLIEDLAAETGEWDRLSPPCIVDRRGLGGLLATPGAPRIAQAYEEASALRVRLAGGRELPGLPQAPPLRPAAISREGFHAWWRELRALNTALDHLRYLANDFDRQVRQGLELLRSLLAHRGGQHQETEQGGLAGLLEKSPAGFSRRDYEELLDTIQKMERTHGTR